jgi:hypothetical protein
LEKECDDLSVGVHLDIEKTEETSIKVACTLVETEIV